MMGRLLTIPWNLRLVLLVCALLALPRPAHAQRTNKGPTECGSCHDHEDELEWYDKRDGENGKLHKLAKKQLNDPKADTYAQALGVDKLDLAGTCVKCHTTIVRNKAAFGISCESCHGEGSDYFSPHQEKGAYQKAVGLGMKDLRGKPENWVKDCLVCHVLGENPTDPKLAAAGHPTGSDFVVGRKFNSVALHWQDTKPKYTENQISGIGNPIRTVLLAKLPTAKPAATPTPPAAPDAPPAAAPPAAAPPTAAPPAAPGASAAPPPSAPPTAPRTPAVRTAPAAVPPALPGTARVLTTAPAAGGDAQTVIQLPPDPQLPPSPTGIVASIQGRLVALLANLLSRDVTTPSRVTPPAKKTVYQGADAELLRLQDEVIALALEALSTAPPKPAQKQ
jgi:Cytochrome c554 and c-prime